jgi:DNA-binding XRE family transcriptional regulator
VGLCQSQEGFAKTLGFAERTIGKAERGTHSPSLALRRALDQALERASGAQRDRFLAAATAEDQRITSLAPATFP